MGDSKTAAGYVPLRSIERTISHLIYSPEISLSPPCPDISYLLDEIKSLRRRIDVFSFGTNERVIPSLTELEEPAHEFGDAVDSLVSKQLLSQSESLGNDCRYASTTFTVDLWELEPEIDSFTRTVRGIRRLVDDDADADDDDDDVDDDDDDDDAAISSNTRSCIDHSVSPWLPEDDDDDNADANSSSSSHPPIGLDDQYRKLFNILTRTTDDENFNPYTLICGMAGIGKSTLAKRAYEDPRVLDHFECCAWVSFHPEYKRADVCLSLLNQLDPNNYFLRSDTNPRELQIICGYVSDIMKSKKCLIVMDDLFERRAFDALNRCRPQNDDDIKGQIILISRILHPEDDNNIIQMNFLNNAQSWHLLRQRVFHNKSKDISNGLEEAGKKIVELCGGLPLLIILVAKHLRKAENLTPEYWSKVAEDGIAFLIEADKIFSERLILSYEVLNPEEKVSFLYLGVFPQDYEISASKIFLLWIGEGLLHLDATAKRHSKRRLEVLWLTSISLVRRRGLNGKIKTCVLHQAYHPLCVMQAKEEKFHHVITGKASISTERMENQRRLCIYNNALFGIKDVHNAMASVSTIVRSLLCTGPHHPYPVPMFLSFDLLRVLDALTIRFYEFPVEMLKLVLLRYLALTYNRQLPVFICKLLSLEFLIVRGDVSIISYGDPSYLPNEIWYMKSLIHLQVPGSALPNPPCGESLPNLVTLLDVSARSCNKEVLDGVPNLEKLGIQIADPLYCFDHLTILHQLNSLKCTIVNPNPIYRVVANPELVSNLPRWITKLSLGGFGYPWDYMSKLAKLPFLEVLKLLEYAFRGQKWEVCEGEFKELKFLIMEDTDLEQLRISPGCLASLERLIIRHCYKLRYIDSKRLTKLKMIELVDCGAATKKMQKKLEECGHVSLLYAHFSAEETK